MAKDNDKPTIIVRRRKKAHGHEHGNTAWKIAYADFVTAMMAFFLMLWLLTTTDAATRSDLADYFSPSSYTLSELMGGTGGLLGGQTITKDGMQPSDNAPIAITPAVPPDLATLHPDEEPLDGEQIEETGGASEAEALQQERVAAAVAEREEQAFEQTAEQIRQAVTSRAELRALSDQLVMEQTPEGLRIQLIDQQNSTMFERGSATPNENTKRLLKLIARVVEQLPNEIAIAGHTDATPFNGREGYGNWELSSDRALASRRAILEAGLPEGRIAYVTGRADQDPLLPEDPEADQNRRISITLLRSALTQELDASVVEALEEAIATGDEAELRSTLPSLLRE